ncbi:MAG TPA: lantibiotic dehydratase [Pseudonocardiaceae bacterium]
MTEPDLCAGTADMTRPKLGNGWHVWGLSALRGAGLPARLVLDGVPGVDPDSDDRLLAALRDPAFVAAIAWQNPNIVRQWVGHKHAEALRGPVTLRASHRRTLAAYLQRYAAKNDTIGFFGPTSVARWSSVEPGLSCLPGAELVTGLRVRLEPWAVQRLIGRWLRDPELCWHLPVNRDRCAVLIDTTLHRNGGTLALDEIDAALFAAADGQRPAAAIAEQLGLDRADARARIERLNADFVLDWGIITGLDDRPETRVREALARVTDPVARERMAGELGRLERGCAELAALPVPHEGEPDALPRLLAALAELDQSFDELTSAAPRRSEARDPLARGRRIVYADATRNVDVRIGADLFDELAGPLRLVLDSARWLTSRVAELARHALNDELDRRGVNELPVFDCWEPLQRALDPSATGGLGRLLGQMRDSWATVLGVGPTDREAHRRTEDLLTPVASAFPAADFGWSAARHHSPDVLLAVPGDGRQPYWVLGELHLAINTLENRSFNGGVAVRDQLLAAMAEDYAEGRVLPAWPRWWPSMNQRSYPPTTMDPPGRYLYWGMQPTDTLPVDQPPVPGAGIVLRRVGPREQHRLRAVDSTGRLDVDAVEFFGEFLSWSIAERFALLPTDWAHVPRVLLGRCVVQRETWRSTAAELVTDPVRILRELGVPRYAFIRTAGEPKPFLLDLADAPPVPLHQQLQRSLNAALARDPATPVTISEMLPRADELWLTDAAGDHYTSEIRMVAVDGSPHATIGVPS